MTVHEFQVVVLAAGRGSRMTELTMEKPKCLLPVGNKPIIWHSLNTLEKAGFKDVIVLVLESDLSQIQQALVQNSMKLNYELIPIPADQSEDWGTADSLRYLIKQKRIKRDVVLMSCDLFTNTDIRKVLYSYRKHKASFAALFFLPFSAAPITVPGIKSKSKPERDVVGIDADTSRLVFLASASDFEENIHINQRILIRHPKISLRSDLVDGHLYVLSYGVAQYLSTEISMSTLKGEFFPYIVGKQSCRPVIANEESSVVNDSTRNSVFEFVRNTKLDDDVLDCSAYNDHDGDLKKAYQGDMLRCYAVIADGNDYGIRINSLYYLCQANELYLKQSEGESEESLSKRIDPNAEVETNQIDSLSFIGAGCKVNEKTSIRTSTLVENCTVSPKSRITKCVIMKNVFINEGCVLDNCIISDNVKIGRSCDLKNCLIGANFSVPDGTKSISQVLSKSDGLMEI